MIEDLGQEPSMTKEDQNPRGGLSAKGRKKFGVKAGVKNYASASRRDKGRWVSWALRFTGTPKPLKDAKGNPTRYALMFRAWGEPVPTTVAAVRKVHAKAVKRSAELKRMDAAELDFSGYILQCSDCDRAFVLENPLWTHVERVHLEEEF